MAMAELWFEMGAEAVAMPFRDAPIAHSMDDVRALDLDRVKALLSQPVLVDLRNVYQPDEMEKAGFDYHSIGRPAVNGAA